MHPAGFEHGVNAWTAVDLAMRQKNLLDVGCELGIFSAMLARRAASPGIIATDGDLKRLANDAACCLRSLNPLRFELVIYCLIAPVGPLLA